MKLESAKTPLKQNTEVVVVGIAFPDLRRFGNAHHILAIGARVKCLQLYMKFSPYSLFIYQEIQDTLLTILLISKAKIRIIQSLILINNNAIPDFILVRIQRAKDSPL